MAEARTIAEVIAGEATYGTPEERWADMVAIASVIQNRARQLGVSPQEVVANAKEFNAYGKALPEGVDSNIVDMAQRAMTYVQDYGPVNDATFYSTPAAQDGLPSGLQEVNRTTGHTFKADPQNRAIDTGIGYVTPSGETASRLMTPYDSSPPAEFSRLYGQQQAALTGNLASPFASIFDPSMTTGQQAIQGILSQPAIEAQPAQPTDDYGMLGPQPLAEMDITPGGHRPYAPETSVTDNIQAAVTSILGPDAKVSVTSGQEGGLAQFGSNRHKTGLAADIKIIDPTGHVLAWDNPNDIQAMKDIAQSAATQQANIGLGYDNKTMMHVDYVPESDFQPGQDSSWGVIGNEPHFAAKLMEARQYALMPDSFYEKANQRVLENNVTPTLNSEQGFTQMTDGTGLMGELSPVASTPIERTALPDVVPTTMNSFADGLAAQRAHAGTGVYSMEMDELRANNARQLANPSITPPGVYAGMPTTSIGVGVLPSLSVPAAVPVEAKPVPSYSEAMSSTVPTVPSQVPLETAMAMETPMFNQALNPSLPSMMSTPIGPSQYQTAQAQTMSQVPGINAATPQQPTVDGPTTTPAVDQQQTAQTKQAVTQQAVQAAKPSLSSRLSNAINPGTAIGGVLGGAALGPIGGMLGAMLGNKMYQGGGLTPGSFGFSNQAPEMNTIGYGPQASYSVWGGQQSPGSTAVASDGSLVSAQAGGDVARTNAFGTTDVANSYGGYSADWSGWY